MISVSVAGRYIQAKKTAKITSTSGLIVGDIDIEQNASGIGWIVGLNLAMKDMDFGLRYETSTKLDFETTVNEDDSNGLFFATVPIPPDGEKARKDLPAVLAAGFDYIINPEMKAGISFNYYFITQADQGDDDLYNDEYKNGYEAGVGFEYKVMPELLVSIGYLYSIMGSNEDTVDDLNIVLDANTIGLGGKYTIMEGLDLTVGLAWAMYTSLENADGSVEYSRDNKMIAIGVDYKAL
jgi:long-subunit fatty acid transport protein